MDVCEFLEERFIVFELFDFVEEKKLWLFVSFTGNDSDIFILMFMPGTESKNDATSFRDDVTLYYSLEMIKPHLLYYFRCLFE